MTLKKLYWWVVFILMAKWLRRRQPPQFPVFCPFVSHKYPKPFRFGHKYHKLLEA